MDRAGNNKSLSSIDHALNESTQLALYLGTSQGCVLVVSLTMPDNEDNRVLQLQSVNAEPIPQAAIKLPGSILCLTTFVAEGARPAQAAPSNATGSQLASSPSSFDDSASGSGSALALRSQDSSSVSSFESRASVFLVVVSEKQAEVFLVPNPTPAHAKSSLESFIKSSAGSGVSKEKEREKECDSSQAGAESPLAKLLTNKSNLFARVSLSKSSFACRSQVVQMRQPVDENCLVSYLATGNLLVYSLPKLRLLLDADFVPYSNDRISSSMCFSGNGHCLYRPSESEINKFTVNAQYKTLINDMLGSLYVPREMPEMPRGNFFKSLFSVNLNKQSDRDELFGECSAGKPQRGLAKHISSSGPSGMDKLKGAVVGTMGYEMRVAREGLDERGEKLSQIEDRTLQMLNSSESYSQAAHQLAQRFKDKKWYQF